MDAAKGHADEERGGPSASSAVTSGTDPEVRAWAPLGQPTLACTVIEDLTRTPEPHIVW